jgi:hypothetical protein
MEKGRRLFLGLGLILLQVAVVQSQIMTNNPPALGERKQLFIDDYLIDSMENVSKVLHQPTRYVGNPIIIGNEPWEKWVIEVDGRPVLYDEETKEFRMYYGCNLIDANAPTGVRYKVCYAVSKDGVHWTKPVLDQVEWEGSRKNNMLKWGEHWMRRPNVMKDMHDSDPNRRFKMTYVDVFGGKAAVAKAYSRDGMNWQLNGDGKPWFRRGHNSNLLGWDPRIQQYVIFPRMPGSPNSVGRATSTDFITWSEAQAVLVPEASDGGKDFKGNAAFMYEDVYLGMLWVFDHNKTAEAELTFSRDGLTWQRVFPGNYFFPRGKPGLWDSLMILPNAPVIHQDKIWIYYAGWNMPYSEAAIEKAEAGWFENGQRLQRAIGLATLRLDGFVSVNAGQETGSVTTRHLKLMGDSLFVNASVRGELRVEILDESNQAIPGYSAADCDPLRGDKLRHRVNWRGKANLSRLRGKQVKLRFFLREGDLYSFWSEGRSGNR